MRGIERAGVCAADSQSIAERPMIEIEHIVLAAMPAEIGDVTEPVVDRAVDDTGQQRVRLVQAPWREGRRGMGPWRNPLRRGPIGAISGRSGSLRLAAQDVALSRRKQGFESPRERQVGASPVCFQSFSALFV